MKPMKALLGIVSGVFVTPFILMFTKESATKLRFLDGIYGNVDDGIGGDSRWYGEWVVKQNKLVTLFPRYWWVAIRNPAHNLLKSMGAQGVVNLIHRDGQVGKVGSYRVAAVVGGEHVSFNYGVHKYPFINRYLRYALGAKLWPQIKVGDEVHQSYAFAFQPFTTAKNAGVQQ